jgi:hypothetical protein
VEEADTGHVIKGLPAEGSPDALELVRLGSKTHGDFLTRAEALAYEAKHHHSPNHCALRALESLDEKESAHA